MFELFLAEFKRSWIQFTRYSTEAIGGIIIITAVFYGLFVSARYIAGPNLQFGDRLDTIIIGYVLWTLVIFIMTDIAGNLQSEAQTGTLEQILRGPAQLDDGTHNFLGALQTSMGTLGAKNIREMQQVEVAIAPSLLTEGKVYQKAQQLGMGK